MSLSLAAEQMRNRSSAKLEQMEMFTAKPV